MALNFYSIRRKTHTSCSLQGVQNEYTLWLYKEKKNPLIGKNDNETNKKCFFLGPEEKPPPPPFGL